MRIYNNTEIGCNYNCDYKCGIIGSIIGIISGIIVSVLFYFGFVPLISSSIWILLGVSGIVLIYILLLSIFNLNLLKFLCKSIKYLAICSLGSILSVIVLSTIVLETTSIIITILIGIATFFLVFLIFLIFCTIKYILYN